MKSPGLIACLLVVGIIFIILNAGCEQEQVPSEKKARLIAVENMDLKKQLQQRDFEVEELKQKHEKELERQKKLLAACQTEKEDLQEQLDGKFGAQIKEIFDKMAEEDNRLLEENESLRQQIKELKGETEENETPM